MLTGENLLAALCLIVLIAVIYWGYCITHKDEPEEIDFFDSRDLQEEVHVLNEKMNRLAELDNMLIELNLCKPSEALRAFRMEWQGVAGKSHGIDFMADGESDSSQHRVELAITERNELNAEIGQRILHLYRKACYLQITEDIDAYSGEGE
jgi:hypothetical protein